MRLKIDNLLLQQRLQEHAGAQPLRAAGVLDKGKGQALPLQTHTFLPRESNNCKTSAIKNNKKTKKNEKKNE
jgi:hypothetical protein